MVSTKFCHSRRQRAPTYQRTRQGYAHRASAQLLSVKLSPNLCLKGLCDPPPQFNSALQWMYGMDLKWAMKTMVRGKDCGLHIVHTAVACVSLLYCGRRLGASEKRAAAAAAAATAHNSAAVGGEAVLRLAQLGEVHAVPLFFFYCELKTLQFFDDTTWVSSDFGDR